MKAAPCEAPGGGSAGSLGLGLGTGDRPAPGFILPLSLHPGGKGRPRPRQGGGRGPSSCLLAEGKVGWAGGEGGGARVYCADGVSGWPPSLPPSQLPLRSELWRRPWHGWSEALPGSLLSRCSPQSPRRVSGCPARRSWSRPFTSHTGNPRHCQSGQRVTGTRPHPRGAAARPPGIGKGSWGWGRQAAGGEAWEREVGSSIVSGLFVYSFTFKVYLC